MLDHALLFRNGKIYTPNGIIEKGNMLVEPGGTIGIITETIRAIRCAALAMRQRVSGAALVGIHLEGPFS
jgi:hypothetical protein